MDYKERMLRELSSLIEKRTMLSNFINNFNEVSNDGLKNETKDLMQKQCEVMCHYEEILIQRILIEMRH